MAIFPTLAWEASLSNYEFRLLYVICHFAGSGTSFKASVEELAGMTGKANEKTVRRALKALEDKGFIKRKPSKRANGYRGIDIIEILKGDTPNLNAIPWFQRPPLSSRTWKDKQVLELYGTVCHLCSTEIDLTAPRSTKEPGWQLGLHIDHVIPLSLGGLDSLENVRPSHAICNVVKGNKVEPNFVHNQVDESKNAQEDDGQNVRTSPDYVSGGTNSHKPLVPNSQDSYKLKDSETKSFKKEIRIPMRKWEDDGEDLAGYGLVEPKDAPQPKIRKSDPKTRGKRPEHEWTPMDVAAEFSYRVGKKYPLLPGTVSVKQLSGALAKFRKQYATTPLIELELLRLFMADESNFKNIGDEAPFLYKLYLSSFGKKMNQARENLGLAKVTSKVETTESAATLVASDGRVFQNSLSGRKQLERHEARLKEASNG